MKQGSIQRTKNSMQFFQSKGLLITQVHFVFYPFFLSFLILCSVLFSLCLSITAYADDTPLDRMKDETLSYFIPLTGTVTSVEDKSVIINLGTEDSVKPGMRFRIIREVAPFKHPVTKETLGNLESPVGTTSSATPRRTWTSRSR